MTKASPARINKKVDKPHTTTNFAQMMSNAQLNALKPFIKEEININGHAVLQKVSRMVLDQFATLQVRLLAFEKILKDNNLLTDDKLALEVANVEDQLMGYKAAAEDAGVAENNRVRAEYYTKTDKDEEYKGPERILINSVNQKNVEGNVQTLPELEASIIGKKVGEATEFYLPGNPEDNSKETMMKVVIKRISVKEEQKPNE